MLSRCLGPPANHLFLGLHHSANFQKHRIVFTFISQLIHRFAFLYFLKNKNLDLKNISMYFFSLHIKIRETISRAHLRLGKNFICLLKSYVAPPFKMSNSRTQSDDPAGPPSSPSNSPQFSSGQRHPIFEGARGGPIGAGPFHPLRGKGGPRLSGRPS